MIVLNFFKRSNIFIVLILCHQAMAHNVVILEAFYETRGSLWFSLDVQEAVQEHCRNNTPCTFNVNSEILNLTGCINYIKKGGLRKRLSVKYNCQKEYNTQTN